MPYIKQEDRDTLDYHIDYLSVAVANGDSPYGEINYCISRMFNNLIKAEGLNYNQLNSLIGVLECAKMEIYRRVAAPYEDKKINENGEVFTHKGGI
tara:strand:- start:73 stop:360 length:288 start_codon:yes stop_codon:yes gene_type:complete